MATTIQQIHLVAHLPLVLGVLRRLEVATVIDRLIPPHPAYGLSCGRGVEALVLAIPDGYHALYKKVRFVVVHSSQLAQQHAQTYASGRGGRPAQC